MDERTYYPQLDGLRFVAFLLVYAFHDGLGWVSDVLTFVTLPVFLLASLFGPDAAGWAVDFGPTVRSALRQNGWVGVQLFFILSGYLITTLLLREEERYGRVDLRAFWMRRILRIWPLYYAIVAITFLLLPAISGRFGTPTHASLLHHHLLWFLAFLGNWSMVFQGTAVPDSISILWSVCVEEQFYIVCPLLIAFVPKRARLPVVAALMAGFWAIRGYVAALPINELEFKFNTFVQLDTLLSGVALALVLDRWPPGERARALAKFWGWVVMACAIWLMRTYGLGESSPARRTWDYAAVWACGVGIVAYPILCDGWARRALSMTWIVWLGRISYGLYMYHEIGLKTAGPFFGLGLTVLIAAASYYGLERPFLRLKRRWTRVPSRPV